MDLKFDNITISGGVAVGKNTLFANLKTYLGPVNWKFRTTGQILRDWAQEHIQPVASLAPDNFHKEIEEKTRHLLEREKKWVIEAWLSGFMARDLDKVLKVLLVCSNEAIRIDRVANRDKISVSKAKEFIKQREEDNFQTWQRIYGDYNFFDKKYYNLIIDTYSSGQLETVGKVLDKLGYDNNKITIEKKPL